MICSAVTDRRRTQVIYLNRIRVEIDFVLLWLNPTYFGVIRSVSLLLCAPTKQTERF